MVGEIKAGYPAHGFERDIERPPQGQAALHQVASVRGHLDPAAVAEEVRCVQQVDVQRVALDPLPAVQQPAQVHDRVAGPDVQGALALHPGQFGDGKDALVLVGHLYGR